uniref:Chemosensory protein csp4 n=1 Tax=Helopeltis theivora TaxID=393766 RepID=A0A4Y5QVY4_9HEMI|nr:chemosensory protein csp4 [Helopeltis theivora]
MKTFLVFFLAALALAAAADFSDIMDVDLKELLSDEARRKQIFDCIMDEGECGDYQIYKDVVPGVVESQCGKCTPEQKVKFDEKNKFLSENYPNEFNAMVLKYAPKPAEK